MSIGARRVLVPITVLALSLGCSREEGRWVEGGELDVVGVHSALMPNGLVLSFGYPRADNYSEHAGRWQMWDPVARAPLGASSIIEEWNPFCAGHCFLGDGRLFVAGGHKHGGLHRASSANRVATARAEAGDASVTWRGDFGAMEDLRWYPTVVTLPNGDGLIIGGSAPLVDNNWNDTNEDVEYFSVANDYLVRHNETQRSFPQDGAFAYPEGDPRQHVSDGERLAGLYPLTHVLPDEPYGDAPGGILFVLTESFLRLYNPTTNQILAPKIDVGGFRTWWTQASSVLLPIEIDVDGNGPDEVRVMVIGGGTLGKEDRDAPALGTAEIWRYSVSSRTITLESTIELRRNRFMGDGILLPDGNVALVGGAEIGYTNENSLRVRFAELIMPPGPGVSGASIDLAEASQLRGYHASALLLPDGAVFVTGGNGNWDNSGPVQEFKSVEVFEPPYLFMDARPQVLSAPSEFARGDTLAVVVEGQAVIDSTGGPGTGDGFALEPVVVLLRNGSRTHSLDTDQRMLRLAARVRVAGGRTHLQVVIPTNPTYAPPGPYMLFVLRRASDPGDSPQNLIPSHGRHVQLVHRQVRPATPVSEVRLTILTGDDNLERDEHGVASLRDYDDTVIVPEFALNSGSEWANHTVHTVTQTLPSPVPLTRFHKLRVSTTFDGGVSGDNWNIDRLIVDCNIEGTWTTIYDESGFPLARLTGDRSAWTAVLARP